MKVVGTILKSIGVELFVLFALVFTVNNYWGNTDTNIASDGTGYYDYLPSIFIHHDFVRKDIPYIPDSSIHKRIEKLDYCYVKVDEIWTNKYPIGTAILLSPFFATTYLTQPNVVTGYEMPFQKAVYYAALFYFFLTLIFIRKLLGLYNISRLTIFLCQILLALGTNVADYIYNESAFSHVYSLFAITLFFYYAKQYFTFYKSRYIIILSVLLGLIFLLRATNLIILLALPFIAGSLANFITGLTNLYTNYKTTLLGITLFLTIAFIQPGAWYLQTGSFIIRPYPGEYFDFTKPELFNILFSYRKGLFVYTPILFIAIWGLVKLAINKKYYLVSNWLLFFGVLTYFLSSWWSWYFGWSFGHRAYIDFYSLFIILLAILLNNLQWQFKLPILVLCLLAVAINIIQTYQYKTYIIDGYDMNKKEYWAVFLKTKNKYSGYTFKTNLDYSQYDTLYIKNFNFGGGEKRLVFKESANNIPQIEKSNIFQIEFENDFNEVNNNRILITIDDTVANKNYYYHERSIIYFAGKEFNTPQTGKANFTFEALYYPANYVIKVYDLDSENPQQELKNGRILFLGLKK